MANLPTELDSPASGNGPQGNDLRHGLHLASTGVGTPDLKATHNPSQSNPITAYATFEQKHWWYEGRRCIVGSLVRKLVRPSKDRLIIDVGCGPGGNIAALAREYTCVGIDTSPLAIEFARDRYREMSFLCGFAPDDLGDDAGRADIFTIMDVLEHVEHDHAMLGALVAAAKPGSHFLITVPAEPALWSPHDDAAGHLRRYTARSFSRLFAELPVEPLLVSHFNSRLYPPVKLIRTLAARRGTPHGTTSDASEGTDLRMPPRPVNAFLGSVFGGESRPLTKALVTGKIPYRMGVSLAAILRRT